MKQNVTRRVVGVLGAATVAVALACSDSGVSDPLHRSSNTGQGAGLSADTGTHTGGSTGNPHDSSGSGTPAPKPVSAFTLAVHVGTPHAGAIDTLQNDPIAGATITVAKFGYIFTGGGGADTIQITEVPVASGTTDANGDVSFPNLKGEAGYVIRATPPAGLNLAAARVTIPQAYSETIKTTLVLRKP
jgi:hypothetical protein